MYDNLTVVLCIKIHQTPVDWPSYIHGTGQPSPLSPYRLSTRTEGTWKTPVKMPDGGGSIHHRGIIRDNGLADEGMIP